MSLSLNMSALAFLLLLANLPGQSYCNVQDPHSPMSTTTLRAYQTVEGLFNFYWKADPLAKQVKFVFVCGQVGGWGKPRAQSQCSCNNPKSCVNCYRWYDAVGLETVATYGIYTNSKNHSDMADTIYNHSPYNGEWNATSKCTYIDDFSWYGLAYLRVYEWLKDPKWLNRSLLLYDWAWQYGWDEDCGGFWWNNCDDFRYKDSITIMEMLHFSAKLAHLFPNESRYLEDTFKIWNWVFDFDDGNGLFSDKFLVSTGAIPEKCCNFSSSQNPCYNTRLSGTSYNQGLLMSATAYLYLRTGNHTYLDLGLRLLQAIVVNYTTSDGVLIDEPRSYQSFEGACWGGADPGGDWYSFNGIFMLHLGYFADLLSQNGSLPLEALKNMTTLVNLTSNSAWSKSAVWAPYTSVVDGCNVGVDPVDPSAKYPKFNWWWRKEETLQTIPPDPKFFFRRRKLGCMASNGSKPLWTGNVKAEENCKQMCSGNPKCMIYEFKLPASELAGSKPTPKVNCWLWPFNRTAYSCRNNNPNLVIAIKRPVGNATCSAKCDSKQPQPIEHGVCYCDSDCARHMDCCLDYADHCKPDKPILCKGDCQDLTARPIPQGGYCWCFDGCNGWFTDNNSGDSCCSDYPQECMGVSMPACLDGRSQVSALSLFLAHLKIETVGI